jgi:hypothetical protein
MGWGSNFGRNKIFSVGPNHPDRIFVPPNLIFKGFRGSLPRVKWLVSEPDHPRPFSDDVRMSGVIIPPNVSIHDFNRNILTVYTRTCVYVQQYVPSKYSYITIYLTKSAVTQ